MHLKIWMRLVFFIKHYQKDLYLMQRRNVRGGKKSKLRLTIAFFINAAGEKELPIVIGKAKLSRCFKGLQNKAEASWNSLLCKSESLDKWQHNDGCAG